jgi:hypothetical protein
MSVMFATVAIPLVAAADRNARRGLRKAVVWFVLFDLFYVFAARVIYPRL